MSDEPTKDAVQGSGVTERLRELGLANVDKAQATNILVGLLDIDSRITEYNPNKREHLYDAYRVVAVEIVEAGTADEVLEDTIPRVAVNFGKTYDWAWCRDPFENLKPRFERCAMEWKERRLLMCEASQHRLTLDKTPTSFNAASFYSIEDHSPLTFAAPPAPPPEQQLAAVANKAPAKPASMASRLITDLYRDNCLQREICEQLDRQKIRRPPKAEWRLLTFTQAYEDKRYRQAVRTWISKQKIR